jgi:hypothetical protein
MEIQLLKDKNEFPTKEVLENALGSCFPVFKEMMDKITDTSVGLFPQWNYYNDGKTWLCKVSYKKKTVFWLSVWNTFFKTGFYFTEKNCSGIEVLKISENLKENFRNNKPIGKLLPFSLKISRSEQLIDLLTIIEYKKSLK